VLFPDILSKSVSIESNTVSDKGRERKKGKTVSEEAVLLCLLAHPKQATRKIGDGTVGKAGSTCIDDRQL
jgi:hypothetical protein